MSVYTVLLLVLTLCFVIQRKWKRSHLPLPPGPKGLPIIGNVLDMPMEKPWEKFHEWRETYSEFANRSRSATRIHYTSAYDTILDSDLVYLDLLKKPIVVVGSARAAIDLFEKRSHIYSDRASLVVVEL